MSNKILISLTMITFLSACGRKTEETKPIRKDVIETVFASGILEAKGTYNLTAQNDGYLVDVRFEENDIVKKGDVLAIIDNPEAVYNTKSAAALYKIAETNTNENAPSIIQAKNSIVAAKQKLNVDSAKFERYKKLFKANSIAKQDYESVMLDFQNSKASYLNSVENYGAVKQQAEQQLITSAATKNINQSLAGNNQIKAVMEGKVYAKNKQKGDFVKKGDVLATIGNPDFIYAKVKIDEGSIQKVKIGQEVVIRLNTNKEKTYKGKVATISPLFEEATQSFTCEIYFDDAIDFKIINTQLQVNITVGKTKNALLIPRNYLDFGNHVTVKGDDKPVKVNTRFVSTDWVQVISGIDENTVIVTGNVK